MTNYCFSALDSTERIPVVRRYKRFQRGRRKSGSVINLVLSETPFLVLFSLELSIRKHISPFMSSPRHYVSKIDITHFEIYGMGNAKTRKLKISELPLDFTRCRRA